METFYSPCIKIPQILLPRPSIDLRQWAVIACDQFTSQPDYWHQVEQIVENNPSTLSLILPEVYLDQPDLPLRISSILQTMQDYLNQGFFVAYEGIILVRRQVAGKVRHGLMLALDLDQYDFLPGSKALIRASEETIIERLPPRVEIRQKALLELPHAMVLIDDPCQTVIEPLVAQREAFKQLYSFDLMLGSGHLSGWLVENQTIQQQLIRSLQSLADPALSFAKYNLTAQQEPLLFAIGDGNHSLAAAKIAWQNIKSQVDQDHPARYALVEVVNVHDPGLEFDAIHRVVFGVPHHFLEILRNFFGNRFRYQSCSSTNEMFERVDHQVPDHHCFGISSIEGVGVVIIDHPAFNLPVGTLQEFLDHWLQNDTALRIDYVHGKDTLIQTSTRPGNLGFYLPVMPKEDLFKTVLVDGVLPRKTFSMGEAREKRFYMECRRIR